MYKCMQSFTSYYSLFVAEVVDLLLSALWVYWGMLNLYKRFFPQFVLNRGHYSTCSIVHVVVNS